MLYFGEELASHLSEVTIWSPDLLNQQDAEQWKHQVSLLLLKSEDLSLISLWSPTLLLEIVRYIQKNKEVLFSDLGDSHRKHTLDEAISSEKFNARDVWPSLDTISCWTSHTSKTYAKELEKLFPGVFVQGKGLLATEAVTTIPYSKASYPILAINSHFYEFVDENEEAHLCEQLEINKAYRLIITTQSGLYRYDTGDMLEVRGYHQNTPILEFVGREGMASDLCGEKLTEAFVRKSLYHINADLVGRCILVPVNAPNPFYRLVIAEDVVPICGEKLGIQLDEMLSENPQYAYARKIGQLKAIKIERTEDIHSFYVENTDRGNIRLSMLKIPSLLLP